jgi:DNA-binding LacI/PurR family transcriptional regulator
MKPSLQARGTLSDVAKAVGVSAATVSNAFNRPDQLSDQLRNKILAVARTLNYPGPNPAARMLSTGFANVIAVVYGEPIHFAFQDPADSAFVGGVAQACGKRGLGLLLLGGGPQSASMIRTAAVDGFIVYSMPKDDVALQAVADRGLPTVIVDQPVLPGIPSVGIDDRRSAKICTKHLKDLGHRHFGIVSFLLHSDGYRGLFDRARMAGSPHLVATLRLQGYLEALKPKSHFSIALWECPQNNEEEGRIAGENLLRIKPRPTAILAMSDRLAVGTMDAARLSQCLVPEDLSVVGFYAISAAKWLTPPLTTLQQVSEDKGRVAVELLGRKKEPIHQKLPTRLLVRGSTAPLKVR